MTIYSITVRDTYCGLRGEFVEEQTCESKHEADAWVKQFKQEYPKDSGYSIKVKTSEVRAAA